MSEGLVLSTNCTSRNKVGDEKREAQPPEPSFYNSFGVEVAKVTREHRVMGRMERALC